MEQLAHLTLAELPGSVAIWVAGIALGVLLGSPRGRAGITGAVASLRAGLRPR